MTEEEKYQEFALPLEGSPGLGPWRIATAWLTDACLVVQVRLASDPLPDGAKRHLYQLLQHLLALAEDHDLARPLAAFLDVPHNCRHWIEPWIWDQDWHRGRFSLYMPPAGEGQSPLDPGDLIAPNLASLEGISLKVRDTATWLEEEARKLPAGFKDEVIDRLPSEGSDDASPSPKDLIQNWLDQEIPLPGEET